MKAYLISLLLLPLTNILPAQTPSPTIVFDQKIHNFGTIRESNGKVSHTFIFKNTGKAPVTIDEVHTGCGCIGNVITQGPIQPGAKGKVTITFDPAYKSGFFSKEIVVLSNNRQHYNRIWIEGTIQPAEHAIEDDYPYNFANGLYLRLKVMAFGYVRPGETKHMELHYANNTNKEMDLRFVAVNHPPGLIFTNPGKIPAKGRGVMKVAFTMPLTNAEEVLIKLHPYVNNIQLTETVDIRVLNGKKLHEKPARRGR